MKEPLIKHCRICGEPVTPTKRRDRKAYWYPRQCNKCLYKPRNRKLMLSNMSKAMSGKGNPRYRPIGSRRLHNAGRGCIYLLIKIADPDVWEFEHRLVMEQMLGRKLERCELIHHKDGNSLNNLQTNLQVVSTASHNKHHFSISTWAIKFSECQRCHSAKCPHLCHGLCKKCYDYLLYHNELESWK